MKNNKTTTQPGFLTTTRQKWALDRNSEAEAVQEEAVQEEAVPEEVVPEAAACAAVIEAAVAVAEVAAEEHEDVVGRPVLTALGLLPKKSKSSLIIGSFYCLFMKNISRQRLLYTDC